MSNCQKVTVHCLRIVRVHCTAIAFLRVTFMKMNFVVCINSFIYFFSDLVPIKRESSRRKAKEGNLAKKHMQERLLEDDEEGGLPGKYLKSFWIRQLTLFHPWNWYVLFITVILGSFYSEIAIFFQIFKRKIPNRYPELEIWICCLLL